MVVCYFCWNQKSALWAKLACFLCRLFLFSFPLPFGFICRLLLMRGSILPEATQVRAALMPLDVNSCSSSPSRPRNRLLTRSRGQSRGPLMISINMMYILSLSHLSKKKCWFLKNQCFDSSQSLCWLKNNIFWHKGHQGKPGKTKECVFIVKVISGSEEKSRAN